VGITILDPFITIEIDLDFCLYYLEQTLSLFILLALLESDMIETVRPFEKACNENGLGLIFP